MKKRTLNSIGMAVLMTGVLSWSGGLAVGAERAPMTPELAAKREMVRKQQEQRITPEKRKAAVQALKAERIKIYNARQAAQKLAPGGTDDK